MRELGMLPSEPMPSPFALRWDPQPHAQVVDEGDVGEGAQGIWSRVHPVTLLGTEPKIWDAWREWRFGLREITREDYDSLSNFELEAKAALSSAHYREEERRRKSGQEEDGDGS